MPTPSPASTRPRPTFQPFTRPLPLDPRCAWLARKGITPQTAARFEAGMWHGRGSLAGCVAVRLHGPEGRPLGYAGRRLDPSQAGRLGQWKLPAGLPKRSLLYNLHRIAPLAGRAVVVVEGPWDVLRLAQLGVPAVALLGTHLSDEQARLLEGVGRVVVMLDGDVAGRAASRDVAWRLRTVHRVDLPDGSDPGDLEDRALRRVLGGLFSL